MPEYGRRSFAEVLPAAIAALGGPAASPSGLSLPRSRAVALLLVDGLGHELLRAHAAEAPFLASLADVDLGKVTLPLGAAALFIELRARMHGLVTLELVGHLHPFNEHGAAFFDAAINRMSADVDAVRRSVGC
mgnify:CR=1 FL=1